jgi:hypothetical protein
MYRETSGNPAFSRRSLLKVKNSFICFGFLLRHEIVLKATGQAEIYCNSAALNKPDLAFYVASDRKMIFSNPFSFKVKRRRTQQICQSTENNQDCLLFAGRPDWANFHLLDDCLLCAFV